MMDKLIVVCSWHTTVTHYMICRHAGNKIKHPISAHECTRMYATTSSAFLEQI